MIRNRFAAMVALVAVVLLGTGCGERGPAAPPAGGGPSLHPEPTRPAGQAPPAAAPAPVPDTRPLAARRQDAIARALDYLVQTQAPDGTWCQGNLGITALCTSALLAGGKTIADPPVRKAIGRVLTFQKPDGGIYDDTGLNNYTTSISLMLLVKADAKAYAAPIEKAKTYLVQHQWDEAESIDANHPWYGGAGYGKHERPDLSNASFFLEAMHQAGVPKDDPLWAKAVVFVSRCQDRSESNDGMIVGADEGGGMIYSPHKGGESKAGTVDLPNGKRGLKAYASMTYAGFKSFVYAGLARDDPRVLAALDWIRHHWSFEENPELGQQGLYYYYMVAAQALKAWGETTVRDAARREHRWKDELTEAILRRERSPGCWYNEADRWMEGKEIAVVPTSYVVIALVSCR